MNTLDYKYESSSIIQDEISSIGVSIPADTRQPSTLGSGKYEIQDAPDSNMNLRIFSPNNLPSKTLLIRNRMYTHVPGQFTQAEAFEVARSFGGHPVVFNSIREHRRVVRAFGEEISGSHTGHFQDPAGKEPGVGWQTYTGQTSAPLDRLFNSNGPDDGINNDWGWKIGTGGGEFWYGPGDGKNEDAAVIWHDNRHLLEDVSKNYRGGVLIEYNSPAFLTQNSTLGVSGANLPLSIPSEISF